MAVKTSTIALISTAIVATFGIGYLVYFDQKRRTDPRFKKQLKHERKKASKMEKKKQEKEVHTVEQLVASVMKAVAAETFPETPEAKEAYFMENVTIGERYVGQGEAFYDQSVEFFYKALKVYPAPLELIMIYQKQLPEKVFRIVVNLMALEQQKRQSEFYDQFPPAETGVKLTELAVEAEKPARGLTADKDFVEGDVLYTETPLISALHPNLEGKYCNYCMKKINEETKVKCTNCDQVVFCSTRCEQSGSQQYHTFLCTNNKVLADQADQPSENAASKFLTFSKENNVKYPQMIAQFLSGMVAEEVEKNKKSASGDKESVLHYSAWDHIERFKGITIQPSEESLKERTMIKELLASKVPGIDEFLTDEIYLLLKGKLCECSYEIPAVDIEEEQVTVEKSAEPVRVVNSEQKGLGSAIYKISSYINKSTSDETNTSVSFKDNTNVLVVTATTDIKKGDQIKTAYV